MPNIENIKKAIQVMERVKQHERILGRPLFNHTIFQGYEGDIFLEDDVGVQAPQTEEEIINLCGTTCCFAGWLAASPEFQHLGLKFDGCGFLQKDYSTHLMLYALAEELGISLIELEGLIYNNEDYFGMESEDITPQDVIDKLKAFIGEE